MIDESNYSLTEAEFWDRATIERALRGSKPILLKNADLSGLDLTRLDMSNAHFERCILVETDFGGSRLDYSTWKSCRGGMARFIGASVAEAKMQASDFSNTHWQRSKLTHSAFTSCKLSGADFSGASVLGISFTESILKDAFLSGVSFLKERIETIDFSGADLTGCDFRYSVMSDNCSLANARITDARFEGADLRGADLAGVRMADPRQFKNALITPTQAGQLIKGLGLRVSV